MTSDSLTITDNRNGAVYESKIVDGTINALDLRKIKTSAADFGLMTYDPAYNNTANCRSSITFIDGDEGILEYRGYAIADLAEHSSHLEVAWLLLHGELPNAAQLAAFQKEISQNVHVIEPIKNLIKTFPFGGHPMGMLQAAAGGSSVYYPESKDSIKDRDQRRRQIMRLIGQMPTLGAMVYRQFLGLPLVDPREDLSYAENFLYMIKYQGQKDFRPDPVLARALDVLFVLHADHEQNCSTSVMRGVGSSHADPFSSVAGAISALYGPLHGGANEAVIKMLKEIGTKDKIPAFIELVKSGKGDSRLMGFGHRVYKNYDPRAKVIKRLAEEVFEVTGRNPMLDIALELERIALSDEYFVKRKLYPNVDFYSGLIYEAMGFHPDFFTVLFAVPRTAGWLTQWSELLDDGAQKIARPRQIYTGHRSRSYVAMGDR